MLLPFLLKYFVVTSLDTPFLIAIAFTVVVSLRVIAVSYSVLCAFGAVPQSDLQLPTP